MARESLLKRTMLSVAGAEMLLRVARSLRTGVSSCVCSWPAIARYVVIIGLLIILCSVALISGHVSAR